MKHSCSVNFIRLISLISIFACPCLGWAQWVTQSFNLVPGWNAIFLNVDATYTKKVPIAIGTPLRSIHNSPIEAIWKWIPDGTVQFSKSPLEPSQNNNWSKWSRKYPNADFSLNANSGYLIYVDPTKLPSGSIHQLDIKGIPTLPKYSWSSSGINLIGLPVLYSSSNTYADYLSFSPELGVQSDVYHYLNGKSKLISQKNNTFVDRGKAFWIKPANAKLNYHGPLKITMQSNEGPNFKDNLNRYQMIIRNMTKLKLAVQISPASSEPPPPTVKKKTNYSHDWGTTLGVFEEYDIETNDEKFRELSSVGRIWHLEPVGTPGCERKIVVGINRNRLSPISGEKYTGIINIDAKDDSSQKNVAHIKLPVTAEVPDRVGLWMGVAQVTHVRHDLTVYEDVEKSEPNASVPPDLGGYQDATVTGWVKISKLPDPNKIFGVMGDLVGDDLDSDGSYLGIDHNGAIVFRDGKNSYTASNSPIQVNTWNHVGAVFKGAASSIEYGVLRIVEKFDPAVPIIEIAQNKNSYSITTTSRSVDSLPTIPSNNSGSGYAVDDIVHLEGGAKFVIKEVDSSGAVTALHPLTYAGTDLGNYTDVPDAAIVSTTTTGDGVDLKLKASFKTINIETEKNHYFESGDWVVFDNATGFDYLHGKKIIVKNKTHPRKFTFISDAPPVAKSGKALLVKKTNGVAEAFTAFEVLSPQIAAAGSGYAVADVVSLDLGVPVTSASKAKFVIKAVNNSGGVTALHPFTHQNANAGYYISAPVDTTAMNTSAVSGSGAGLKIKAIFQRVNHSYQVGDIIKIHNYENSIYHNQYVEVSYINNDNSFSFKYDPRSTVSGHITASKAIGEALAVIDETQPRFNTNDNITFVGSGNNYYNQDFNVIEKTTNGGKHAIKFKIIPSKGDVAASVNSLLGITAGGSGYKAGDIVQLNGGTPVRTGSAARFVIKTVDTVGAATALEPLTHKGADRGHYEPLPPPATVVYSTSKITGNGDDSLKLNVIFSTLPGFKVSSKGSVKFYLNGKKSGVVKTSNVQIKESGLAFVSSIVPASIVNYNIVKATIEDDNVIVTTQSAHNFKNGDSVIVAGSTPQGYNGTHHNIIILGDKEFSFLHDGSNLADSSQGTVKSAYTSALVKSAYKVVDGGAVAITSGGKGTGYVVGDQVKLVLDTDDSGITAYSVAVFVIKTVDNVGGVTALEPITHNKADVGAYSSKPSVAESLGTQLINVNNNASGLKLDIGFEPYLVDFKTGDKVRIVNADPAIDDSYSISIKLDDSFNIQIPSSVQTTMTSTATEVVSMHKPNSFIGRIGTSSKSNLQGAIHNLRVYSSALNLSEINDDFGKKYNNQNLNSYVRQPENLQFNLIGINGGKRPSGRIDTFGKVRTPYKMKFIFHRDSQAVTRLVQRVFLGASTKNEEEYILANSQSFLDADNLDTSQRFSSVHLPFTKENAPWSCTGDIDKNGILKTKVVIKFDDQINNPFLHTYHPDHDNSDAEYNKLLIKGIESWQIDRIIDFEFNPEPINNNDSNKVFGFVDQGTSVLGGRYLETVKIAGDSTNIKQYQVLGNFAIKRIIKNDKLHIK